jgi:hypothetical protein
MKKLAISLVLATFLVAVCVPINAQDKPKQEQASEKKCDKDKKEGCCKKKSESSKKEEAKPAK